MSRALPLVMMLVACGGSSASRPPEPKSPAPPPVAHQGAITPEVFCERFVALRDGGCAAFATLTMTRDECVKELSAATSDPQEAAFVNQTGQCVVGFQSCNDVIVCLKSLGPKEDELRACNANDPGKAVGLPRAEYEKRNGAAVTKFSDAKSTKDLPLEVCTIDAETEWLTSLSCDDGRQPIAG